MLTIAQYHRVVRPMGRTQYIAIHWGNTLAEPIVHVYEHIPTQLADQHTGQSIASSSCITCSFSLLFAAKGMIT